MEGTPTLLGKCAMDHSERTKQDLDVVSETDGTDAAALTRVTEMSVDQDERPLASRHPNVGETFAAITARRLSRRSFLQTSAAAAQSPQWSRQQ
ncbi:MAG: hypothetical protein HC834_05690 [Rhodospirillales bacterium]|nr:hypothetical protein [Rhodospirillales bacterium]